MELQTKLAHLIGVGPTLGSRLSKLGLTTIQDLLYYFPFRYDDFSNLASVVEAQEGEVVTVKGQVWSIANTFTRQRKVITKAILNDGSGSIELVWFNQSWLTKSILNGSWLQVSGKVNRYKNKVSLLAPQWEKIVPETDNLSKHTGRLVPIYPETYGLTSKWIRNKLFQVLPRVIDQVNDPLPEITTKDFIDLKLALKEVHFPTDFRELQKARERLAFDELIFVQLDSLIEKERWVTRAKTKPLQINRGDLERYLDHLPFKLTSAQIKVIKEIINDIQKEVPMNRLVQGDVGSGKTVVASVIAYLTHLNNLKTILMAPTEILAFQHHQTLSNLLSPYGITVGLYTASRKFNEKTKYEVGSMKNGKNNIDSHTPYSILHTPNIIVGTHALLSEKLILEEVGLVVVDEQQRFGVEQRALLRSKARTPHFLTMTATPIPRTVALTIYGDLDLSVIDELPKGRQPISTHFVPEKKRLDAYKFIEKEVKDGRQVYIITPLIEESETLITVKAAKIEFERLQKEVFPNLRLGLLHGKLSSKDKEQVLLEFKNHHSDILVSTSVVEVGVDVPNATIMMIEGAERFGLSQLHQLRGRVGRGEAKSYCFLFSSDTNPFSINRLKNLETIRDGLKLAELDLKIRGSGELYGIKQSGQWNLKIASLDNLELIEKTRQEASKILSQDPNLDKHPLIKAQLPGSEREISPD